MSETITAREPVLIVGAGPVGLTLALALAGHGVRSVLVDRRDGEPHVGSRSICVARATLEVFERVAGCGRQMADEGVSWTLGRTYFRDKELFQIRFPSVGREFFPPFVNLGQQRVEEILIERMAGEPLIEARWNRTIEGFEEDEGGVTLRILGPDGSEEIWGSYLVGADGSRSRVRQLAGIGFPGHAHEDRFLIADIRTELPFPDERRFYFDHPKNPGRQVLIHPQPDNVWRIDWQVPPEVDLEEEERTGRLHERIRAVVGDGPYEIVWKSLYTFHQRRASRFRSGRVLLAGDAAHVFAPFGARGMNSGVQDAENLAWKLWLVWAGLAPDALLDTYDAERRAAADHNLAVTDATMRFMVPPTRLRLLLRNLLLRGSLFLAPLRRFVNSGRLSDPFVYRGSEIVEREPEDGRSAQAVEAGALAPDGPCRTVGGAGEAARIRDLFGRGFVGLYFAAGPEEAGSFHERAAVGGFAVPTELVAVLREAPDRKPPFPVVVDVDGVLVEAYGARAGTLVLVRPDAHLAARRKDAEPEDLGEMVKRAAARSEGGLVAAGALRGD
jgi:2-polyprenyl-6-methoxyphenol hydroxylase-like FAD-dependent oxidoreductase